VPALQRLLQVEITDYKKNNMNTDREKGRGNQRAKSDKRITGKGNITTLCTNLAD
jgi:hypothetical protein